MEDFKNKAKKGGKWLAANQLISQFSRIIFSILLARMLLPQDFGSFAKVIAVIGVADIFLQRGIGSAIIQDKKITKSQISSIFWIYLGLGIFLAIILITSLPLVERYYKDNNLAFIYIICSFNILLLALGIIPRSLLSKQLNFKGIFIAQFASTLISGFGAVILAFLNYGVLSLVFQYLANSFLSLIVIFFISKFSPQLTINIIDIKSHLKFGMKILGNEGLSYISRNADNFLIGRNLGDTQLGYYNRAYTLMYLPIIQINQVFNGLFLPVFTELRSDPLKIKKVFIDAQNLIVIGIIPWLIMGFFSANDLIILLLGEKWIPSISVFRILMIVGFFHSISAINSSIFMGFDRLNIPLIFALLTKPLLVVVIYFLSMKGINEVAIGITIILSLSSLYLLNEAMKIIDSSIWELMKKLKYEYISIVCLALILFLVNSIHFNQFYNLIASLLSVIIFYVIYRILFPKRLKKLVNLVK